MIWKILFIPFLTVSYSYAQNSWTLQQCLDSSLIHNNTIRQSAIDLEISKLKMENRYIEWFPSFNAGISHGYNWGQTIDPFTNEFATDRVQYNNFFLSSSTTLFSGFDQLNSAKITEQNKLLQGALNSVTKRDIQINIVRLYLDILTMEELISINRQSITTLNEDSKRLEKLVNQGFALESDLIKINAELLENEFNQVKLCNNRIVSLSDLQRLIGLSYDSTFTIQGDIALQAPDVIYSQLDSEISDLSQEIELLELKRLKSNYSPSLVLNAAMGSGYSENNQLLLSNGLLEPKPFRDQVTDNFYQTISLTLNIPIFNGNKTNLNAKIHELEVEKIISANEDRELEYANRLLLVDREVLNCEALVKSAMAMVEATELSFNQVQLLLFEGEVGINDYLNELENLKRAESELRNAQYSLRFNRIIADMLRGNIK